MTAHRLGPTDLVPPGEGRNFRVGTVHLAVFHPRDGTFHATQATCPHKNGPLADGLLGGKLVVCPLHARKFDVSTGECLNGDETLRTFPLDVVDGQLVVDVCAHDCDAA
ncbi:MAG: Rieske (2Fe-2S) protein [Polyangiales bacterium]